jgi:hypothetical protein
MKKIGLVDGIGPESTLDYYRNRARDHPTISLTRPISPLSKRTLIPWG